jgi:putative transcriptional regulator
MSARRYFQSATYHVVVLASLLVCLTGVGSAQAEEFRTGQLLVASTEMTDPRFVETVIYLVKHDAEGAFGLVINRPLAKGSLEDLLKELGIGEEHASGDIVLHYGGPVSRLSGFILHSDDVTLATSTKVKDGIAMTTDTKIIQMIAQAKGPQQYLVMLGYAGWAPGQLEDEISAGAWHTIPADKALIFGGDADKKWRQAMDRRQVPL